MPSHFNFDSTDEEDVYESDFQSTEEESDGEDPLTGEKQVELEAKEARRVRLQQQKYDDIPRGLSSSPLQSLARKTKDR